LIYLKDTVDFCWTVAGRVRRQIVHIHGMVDDTGKWSLVWEAVTWTV